MFRNILFISSHLQNRLYPCQSQRLTMTSDFHVTPYDDISQDFDVTIDNYLVKTSFGCL